MTVLRGDFSGDGREAWLWPRLLALAIDALAVLLILQCLTGLAYHVSQGRVQGLLVMAVSYCQPVSQLPRLDPEPPIGINFALRCERTFLGLTLANVLDVGKAVQTGERSFERRAHRYYLSKAGEQVRPLFIVQTTHLMGVFVIYLAIMDWLTGISLGKAIVGLRTVDASSNLRRGISIGKVIRRHVSMHAGPLLFASIFLAVESRGSEFPRGDELVQALFWPLVGGWILWNAGRLLIKAEPLYDLAAGTTVVRRA